MTTLNRSGRHLRASLATILIAFALVACGSGDQDAQRPRAGEPTATSARQVSTIATVTTTPTPTVTETVGPMSPAATSQATPSATATPPAAGQLLFSVSWRSASEALPRGIYVVNGDGSGLHRLDLPQAVDEPPVWSPDGQQIAFAGARSEDSAEEIWVVDADGSNARALTGDLGGTEPAWSPDGQRLAFVSDPGPGHGDIYVVDRDGGNLRRLTSDERDDHTPVWSPDGQQLAFMAFTGVGPIQELYVMAADGSNPRKLATNPQPFDNNRPVWSPDSTRIAYLVSDPNDRTQVWVINADGSDPRKLADDPRMDDVHQDEWTGPPGLAWSPDGRQLAFTTVRDGNAEIYVMNPDGSEQRNLTNDPAHDDLGPVWSPDGQQIAFISREVGIPPDDFDARNTWAIRAMDADGSNQRVVLDAAVGITGSSTHEFQPPVSWHPAGPDSAFWRTWARSDLPVVAGRASRTWMWGPAGFSGIVEEDYAESPAGMRAVQYFDKSRMEVTQPDDDPTSPWYVTNGLLVVERAPAAVNIAGDPGQLYPLTYAHIGWLLDAPPHAEGQPITAFLKPGPPGDPTPPDVGDFPPVGQHGVTAGPLVAETSHRVADVFWAFITATGTVFEGGRYLDGPLFPNPFYATGFPIAEAYWAAADVGGQPVELLIQCFERRCLTYTPGNPEGWRVEAGNVGRHYYE